MFATLNVYLKNRFCGQITWESERNLARLDVLSARIGVMAGKLVTELDSSWPSPVYAEILKVIDGQVGRIGAATNKA